MLPKILTSIFGSRNERLLKQYRRVVAQINLLEPGLEGLTDEALKAKTGEFRERHAKGESLDAKLKKIREKAANTSAQSQLDEMKRLGKITPEQAQTWQTTMAQLFPNVKAGDRITGVHRAGMGAAFWLNGKATGEINDVEFARLFFGIWLAEGTSEPAMRQSILGLRPA